MVIIKRIWALGLKTLLIGIFFPYLQVSYCFCSDGFVYTWIAFLWLSVGLLEFVYFLMTFQILILHQVSCNLCCCPLFLRKTFFDPLNYFRLLFSLTQSTMSPLFVDYPCYIEAALNSIRKRFASLWILIFRSSAWTSLEEALGNLPIKMVQ